MKRAGRIGVPLEKVLETSVAKVGQWVKAISRIAAGMSRSQP